MSLQKIVIYCVIELHFFNLVNCEKKSRDVTNIMRMVLPPNLEANIS